MADHDQQRLIELDSNESPRVVFKVSNRTLIFSSPPIAILPKKTTEF